jgi:RHS repeat-associated protein
MNRPRLVLFFLLLLLLVFLPQLDAQVGNNNPTGVSGIFNGQVHTGCSYDPYTGNAHRTIPDLVVAGATGKYPLALTRTSNSRDAAGSAFGKPGGWRHNYQWILASSTVGSIPGPNPPTYYLPPSYSVIFPDGRTETFTVSGSDPYFRTTPGVRDRFQQLTAGTNLCYLLLPDGGKVEFRATLVSEYDSGANLTLYWNTYVTQAIIDPYGQRTTFTYDASNRLSKVTEPAGRYLQFYYRTAVGETNIIDHVTEVINGVSRRSVQYTYSTISPGGTNYLALSSVVYYGDTTWTARYTYRSPNNAGNAGGVPLLSTADDPMYSGPMRRIGYVYKTGTNPDQSAAVYGQLLSENYYDGTNIGAAVSTLEITDSTHRKETRGDGKTRTFTYLGTGYLSSLTDFMGHSASQTYDANKYINSLTDRNSHTTNYTSDPITGLVTQIKFPSTPNDTQPPQTEQTRSTVNYTYENGYYLHTSQDEGGHTTTLTRDASTHRVTRVDYPDGGYETFAYNSFGQVVSHRTTTAGTETFTYDGRGLKQDYRNPSNASGNPTARYQYDGYDRVTGVTDVLGSAPGDTSHTTNFAYNLRGQVTVTTLPTDPVDGGRHSIGNSYNPNGDGTLISATDQLGHLTSYAYDDYRRVKSVTSPARYTGDTTHTTELSYYVNGIWDDYRYTDSSVAWIHLPSGKWINTVYDDNRRKTDVTVGWGTADAATTHYLCDNVGNVTSVTDPATHITTTVYDERNRPSSISRLSHTTTLKYDLAGRKKSVTRPNSEVITYDTFDAMNRVLQQTVSQTPDPAAVTHYTYTQAGLLDTMQDPRGKIYSYLYDSMGRKTWVTYPEDAGGVQRVEGFTYDTSGRLQTFRNRNGNTQTFTYDALNRMTNFSWDDGGVTPSVTFGYDIASRLTSIINANATISREYFNDNLLKSETETATGGVARQVSYTYDADGNRDTLAWTGSGATFSYTYTGRNQLKEIKSGATTLATYGYDLDGKVASRDLNNSTHSTYAYDAFDRVTWVLHYLNGGGRTFTYGYESDSDNLKWAKRLITPASAEANKGEVFDYDQADQVTAVKLNILNPDTTEPGSPTIIYDANGNRSWFTPNYPAAQYFTNDLSQYSSRTIYYTGGQQTTNAVYNSNGDLTTGLDGSTCTYDAQNRLLTASKSGVTYTFKYDGLNRQVKRTVGATSTYSVWDGWDLVQEYQGAGTVTAAYLYGVTGLVKNLVTNNYYYQDGSGSTSSLATSGGALLEWYRYDLQGTPTFYNAADVQITGSNYGVRHLFTGQQWYSELGLYDSRNRFYSPDIGRFLQPDLIGFWGDATNLYRYCGNNPVRWRDPSGLQDDSEGWAKFTLKTEEIEAYYGSEEYGSDYNKEYTYDLNTGEGFTDRVSIGGLAEFPSALEHPLGGVSSLRNSPHSGRADAGSAGDGGRGGGAANRGYEATPLANYRLEIDPNKIIVPVTKEFASYDLEPFGNAVYYGASAYAIAGLAGIGTFEAATSGAFEPFRIDGPSTGFIQYGRGRIIGLRYGSTPLVHLDYDRIPGSGPTPVLHLNVGPQGGHVPLWPWW